MASSPFSTAAGCSAYEMLVAKEQKNVDVVVDPFVFPPRCDDQVIPYDICSGYNPMNWNLELGLQDGTLLDAAVPLMESIPSVSLFSSLDVEQNPFRNIQEDTLCMNGDGFGIWNELGSLLEPNKRNLLLCNGQDTSRELTSEIRNDVKRNREEKIIISNGGSKLTRQTISQYFYMPITQAAKELNVGLTLLKKRCRELGIQRWPHRKLMSLQTLIKNLKEMGKVGGQENEAKLREAIDLLERERKLLEEAPDMQLEQKTKRLRQACFKANYKKRKLMRLMDRPRQPASSGSLASSDVAIAYDMGIEDDDDDDDDEIKSLLCDSFPAAIF